jgi:hypothetical protein
MGGTNKMAKTTEFIKALKQAVKLAKKGSVKGGK